MKKLLASFSQQLMPVIKIGIAICAICGTLKSPVQAQNWSWARSAGGSALDQSRDVVADAAGNIYVTGFFGSPTITIGSTTLTNSGGNDIFLIKYDSSGVVLWAKSYGGSGSEGPNGIAIDPVGYIYVTGASNSSSLNFGTITLSNAGGGTDLFVVKIDSSGNAVWARSAGGTSSDQSQDISTDASGALYVTGQFNSSSIVFGSTTLTSAGSTDGFVAKYDSSGNVVWAKSIGGTSSDRGNELSSTYNGQLLVCGTFYSPSITIGSTTLTNIFGDDIFIAKLDSAGSVIWAKSAGGNLADESRGISTDSDGNVYLGGHFNSSSITFGSITLSSAGPHDIYLAKYDSSGNVVWAKRAGGAVGDFLNGITTDASGITTMIGYFESSSITFGTITLINAGPATTADIMAVQYDSSGTVLWAKKAGGAGADLGYGICSDATGNFYFTGNFESPSCSFGTTNLNNNGSSDVFVAKINVLPTGINELNSKESSMIYPNPATDMFTVQLTAAANDSELIISDMTGKTVYHLTSINNTVEINTSAFPAGVYGVKIHSRNFSETKRLMVVR